MCQHHPVHRSVEPVTGGRPDARSSPHPLLHHVLIALPPVPYEGVVAPPVVDVAEFRHGKDWQRGRARWPPRSPPSALPLSVRAPRPAPAPAREDARPGRSSRGPPDPSQDPGTFRKEEAGGRRRRKGVRSLSGYSGEGRPPRSSGALPAGGGSGCGAAREAGLSARTPATARACTEELDARGRGVLRASVAGRQAAGGGGRDGKFSASERRWSRICVAFVTGPKTTRWPRMPARCGGLQGATRCGSGAYAASPGARGEAGGERRFR